MLLLLLSRFSRVRLRDPMDCSPPGSSIPGIFQARVLEWVTIAFPEGLYSQGYMVFPLVTYGCESWTVKKSEHRGTDAFELWCWRRLLRVSCTARGSILREINPGYAREGLMLKLTLQYFGRLMQTADSLEKSLMLGKIEGRRR